MKKPQAALVKIHQDQVEVQPVESQIKYLFTTSTCPNCKIAKGILEGEDYQLIDAEENPELARKYGVMQAPTLVVVENGQAKKYVNASNIQRYVDEEE